MNTAIIIVAAGKGTRMKSELPKQFLPLGSSTVLNVCVQRFAAICRDSPMVIVYNPEFKDLLSVTGASESQIHFVAGGKERSDSVFNGLSYVAETFKNCRNVLIHDAARPFVSGEVVQSLINELSNYHAAIPVIDLKDSLREKKANSTVAVDRSSYCLVQTPQAFRLNSLMSAFQRTEIRVYTDEASLMESQGYEIKTTKGDDLLFKITSPLDYTLAIAISNEV